MYIVNNEGRNFNAAEETLRRYIEDNFNMRSYRYGDTVFYLTRLERIPDSYTDRQKKKFNRIIEDEYREGKMNSTKLNDIAFIVEWSKKQERALKYLPIDMSLIERIEGLSDKLDFDELVEIRVD